MGNRSEQDMQAIQDGLAGEGPEAGDLAARGDFKSRFVHEFEGVPKDPAVLAAVDKWADVWGKEVIVLQNHEGLLSDTDEAERVANEKLAAAASDLSELLPDAHFGTGVVTFDGGHVQLSA